MEGACLQNVGGCIPYVEPDVYEGAADPGEAFFATAVKMAAVAITVRVVFTAFPGIGLAMAADRDFSSLFFRWCSGLRTIGQTNSSAHGLFRDRPHRLRVVGLAAGGEAGASAACLAYMAIIRHERLALCRYPLLCGSTVKA